LSLSDRAPLNEFSKITFGEAITRPLLAPPDVDELKRAVLDQCLDVIGRTVEPLRYLLNRH